MWSLITAAACLIPPAIAAPAEKRSAPTVALDYSTVVGYSFVGVDSWKGIPYAQPPVGPLRLKPPQAINSTLGTIMANGIPRACPQFYTSLNTGDLPEDVLTKLLVSTYFSEL